MRKYSNDSYQFSNQFVTTIVDGVPQHIFNDVVDNVSSIVYRRTLGGFNVRNWDDWEPHHEDH